MAMVIFTRPDGAPVAVNSEEVVKVTPVPPKDSPIAGPLETGTRIVFKNKTHQDVKELVDAVTRELNSV